MFRSRHLLGCALAASLICLTAGCSDDASQPADEPFSITVTVLDADGQPLADAPVVVLPDLPPGVIQDDKQAASVMPAAVRLPFIVAQICLVDLEILDVAGDHVRQLLDGFEAPAGRHEVVWNGRDDEGGDTLTGWYEAVLVCRDAESGEVLYEGSRGMLRIDVDSDLTPFVTGVAGTVTITDRRLVPGFWDLPPVLHVDENGDVLGEFTLTEATQLRSRGGRTTFDAVDGPQAVTVQATVTGKAVVGVTWTERGGIRDGRDDPGAFALEHPYPNPFN